MGSSGSVYRPNEREQTNGANQDLSSSANSFTLGLYRELAKVDGNLVTSPFCLNILLSILRSGAGGKTAVELTNALDYSDLSVSDMQDSFQTELSKLKSSNGCILELASSVWIQDGTSVKQSFKDAVTFKFHAQERDVDFRNHSQEVTLEINEWGKDKTEGMIPFLLAQEVDSKSVMILVNAVYLRSRWQNSFEIRDDSFYSDDSENSSSTVQFMYQQNTFRYHKDVKLNVQMLLMDYAGGEMSMVLLLPKSGTSLQEVEQTLNYAKFVNAIGSCRETLVDVTLPVFDIESNFDLARDAQNTCIQDIFQTDTNFTGIADDVAVSSVIQKAVIKVTEEGNEDAIVTAASKRGIAARIHKAEQFKADRPFLFLILDKRTDLILLVGRVKTFPNPPKQS